MTSVHNGARDDTAATDDESVVEETDDITVEDADAVVTVGAAATVDDADETGDDTGFVDDGDSGDDGELLTRRQRRIRGRARRKEARRTKRANRSPLNKGIRRTVLVVGLAFVALVGYSFASALLKNTNDPIESKAVGWFRDHNLGFIPNTIEKIYYSVNAPEKGGELKGGIPSAAPAGGDVGFAQAAAAASGTPVAKPTNVVPFVPDPEPGEGVWQPSGKQVDGQPVMYQTFIRPDAEHTGQVVGLAWINGKKVSAQLYNGTEEPGGAGWARGAKVEPADYGPLIATFNGGFKLEGSLGGYYAEGRMVKPLVDGRASMIIKNDGSFTVGEWGRDAVMGPDIVAVRQNLSMLIDKGQIAPDVDSDFQSRWGATLGNSLYVWRSGVGVDEKGNIIYAGGPAMSVSSLAEVLKAAGAYNAMELDINTVWVSMHTYLGGENGTQIESFKLLDSMQRPANRHLQTGTRDFVALFAKPGPPPAPITASSPAPSPTSPARK